MFVATLEECRTALNRLVGQLAGSSAARQKAATFDRTISCTVPDLSATFTGRLSNGQVSDLTTQPAPPAQIRLTAQSDDLVAIADGRLATGEAWKSGRFKVQASMMDLLKLRSMF